MRSKPDHRPAPTEDEKKKLDMIDAIKAQIDAKHGKKKTPRQK